MFNLQGSEIIFILLLALVVLGPEKLPGAVKRAMQTYAELRKIGSGFQDEFKSAIDQPMREMRETADLMKNQIDPKKIAEDAERAVETSVAADRVDAELASTGDSTDAFGVDGSDESPVVDVVVDSERDGAGDFDDPFEDPFGDPIDAVDPVDEPDGEVDDPASLDPGAPVDDAGDLAAPSAAVDDDVDEVADEAMEESA